MGWRADVAYEKEEAEEWRRFMAAQPLWRRVYIRAWQCLVVGGIAAIVFGPFVVGIVRGHF